MVRIVFAMLFLCGIGAAYADKTWTPWLCYFYYQGNVQCVYAIKYDQNIKSDVIQLDYFTPNTQPGTNEVTSGTGKLFRLVKNENPEFFSYIKESLDKVLRGVESVYNGSIGQSAYGYFSIYYDSSDSVTNIKIQGIKTRAYKQ